MGDRGELLRDVMRRTGTSQSELARVSGAHQPSISQFVSGKVDLSDSRLDQLLACMGQRLEVVRRSVVPELTRSEWRSWLLHRKLAARLTAASLSEWRPLIESNLRRLRAGARGQPHVRNLERWGEFLRNQDVKEVRRSLTGLARDSIELREVSPMGGLLTQEERLEALAQAV